MTEWHYLPVPLRLTFCGLAPPSSKMLSVPVFVPFPFGLKRTDIEQLEPAGIPDEETQLFDCKKLEVLTLMLDTCRATLPLFDTETVCAALVVPVLVLGKTKLVVDNATVVPVPVKGTV